jgi:hypothetical protein
MHVTAVAVVRHNCIAFQTAQVHRLGLQQMVCCGHLLLTTGKTGSVKLWPETQLRCTASEAGEHIQSYLA